MTRKQAYQQVQDRRRFVPVSDPKLPAGVKGTCFLHRKSGRVIVIGETHLHEVQFGTTLRTVKFNAENGFEVVTPA